MAHASVWQRFIVVGFTCFLFSLLSIWKKPVQNRRGKKETRKNPKQNNPALQCRQRDDVELILTVCQCTFWKLTKEFACKQHWCSFGDEDTSSSKQCVLRFSFQNPDASFAYQKEWDTSIPSSTRSEPWLSMNCNEPPSFSARNSAGIKAERRKIHV